MDEKQKQKQKLQLITSRRGALTIKFIKITQQFLVSVSLVSSIIFLILSYSSVLFRNFNFHISPLSSTTTLERKYAFLICNVVVAFLAKSLKYSTSSSSAGSSPTASSIIGDQLATTSTEERTVTLGGGPDQEDVARTEAEITGSEEVSATIPEAEEDEEELDEIRGEPMRRRRRSTAPSLTAAEDDDQEIRNIEAELQNNVSAEELNRKFDEFIRKMKEEIRTEARRQLITAKPRHLPKHSE